ncbi:transcriptional regulator [Salmonella enterica]|nr:transcriptional regulator [Salmonella enterica]
MRTTEALAFFGGDKRKLAKAAGLTTVQTVYKWGELVPEGRAARLQEASGGVLVYDTAIYDQYRRNRREGLNHENQSTD